MKINISFDIRRCGSDANENCYVVRIGETNIYHCATWANYRVKKELKTKIIDIIEKGVACLDKKGEIL